jgi:hypothetical protein
MFLWQFSFLTTLHYIMFYLELLWLIWTWELQAGWVHCDQKGKTINLNYPFYSPIWKWGDITMIKVSCDKLQSYRGFLRNGKTVKFNMSQTSSSGNWIFYFFVSANPTESNILIASMGYTLNIVVQYQYHGAGIGTVMVVVKEITQNIYYH